MILLQKPPKRDGWCNQVYSTLNDRNLQSCHHIYLLFFYPLRPSLMSRTLPASVRHTPQANTKDLITPSKPRPLQSPPANGFAMSTNKRCAHKKCPVWAPKLSPLQSPYQTAGHLNSYIPGTEGLDGDAVHCYQPWSLVANQGVNWTCEQNTPPHHI